MNKINFTIIFIVLSLIWLSFFTYRFIQFNKINREITMYSGNLQDVENLKFVERNVQALEMRYESTSRQFFSTKSTSEFVAKLPKLAELSGITGMNMENTGVKKQGDMEITELKITTTSMFPNVANFIDILERSKLPIQIANLNMVFSGNNLNTEMSIRIYKKSFED